MGSGKSSVGRRIAARTKLRFADTDTIVSSQAGQPIVQIFESQGESAFRDMEAAVLRDLANESGIVLATGGGILTREGNLDTLRKIGIVAWLDAAPDVLFERVSRNQKRPLLHTDDPRATFDTLLAGRRSIYEAAADFRVDSTGLSHDDTARLVIDETLRLEANPNRSGFGS
jgi:shikimate kinase